MKQSFEGNITGDEGNDNVEQLEACQLESGRTIDKQ
jgi:hypothetical protein